MRVIAYMNRFQEGKVRPIIIPDEEASGKSIWELLELAFDHEIYHIFYDFPTGLPKIHEHDGKPPQGFGMFHDGRLILFYTYETNISDGWADPEVHNDPPDKREEAFQMGINIVLYALTH